MASSQDNLPCMMQAAKDNQEYEITFNWQSGASVEYATTEEAKKDIAAFAHLLENLAVGESYTVKRLS